MRGRVARLDEPRPADEAPLGIVDVDPGPLAPADVELAVRACGVCRTDLQLCEGDLAAHRLPVVPGHQIVGTVTACGTDVVGVEPGDRVGVSWLAGACGTCRFCRRGQENLCRAATFTGWDRDGGFGTRARADHRFVTPLPDGFADLDAAPLLCGGVIGYRAMAVAGFEAGMRVGLYGFGASATIVIQLARHRGCDVYVVTRSAAEQERARALGAAWAGSYGDPPPVRLDAAITFAPVGDVVVAALGALERGGTVAVNAIHLDRIPEFSYDRLWHERSIRSVANVTRSDIAGLVAAAAAIPLQTQVQRYPLAEANRALVDLRDGRVAGAAVLEMPAATQ